MSVVALGPLLHHVQQMAYVLVNQIFLEPSALHAIQHIMAIQIATVNYNSYKSKYIDNC